MKSFEHARAQLDAELQGRGAVFVTEIDVSACEDGVTGMIYLSLTDGDILTASFDFAGGPVDPETFDATPYLRKFGENVELQ